MSNLPTLYVPDEEIYQLEPGQARPWAYVTRGEAERADAGKVHEYVPASRLAEVEREMQSLVDMLLPVTPNAKSLRESVRLLLAEQARTKALVDAARKVVGLYRSSEYEGESWGDDGAAERAIAALEHAADAARGAK